MVPFELQTSLLELIKMKFLMNRESNSFYEILLLLIFLIISSQKVQISNFSKYFYQKVMPVRNCITLEGRQTFCSTNWTSTIRTLFGNNFKAFWHYLNKDIKSDIFELKEFIEMGNDDYESTLNEKSTFIVSQSPCFEIEKNIYCKIYFDHGEEDEKDEKIKKTKIIVAEIYSYKYSIQYLKDFIDTNTKKYIQDIESERANKLFMYTLLNTDIESKNWFETEFVSTKTFDNMYFEGKNDLISKIDHFQNNYEWYQREGLPYTLGIGLHGEPGTGKTSIIKCIANKLKRHVICIPLNKIKTEEEFFRYYFEEKYSKDNYRNIGFNDKIIVFEDIDCMSSIVFERNSETENKEEKETTKIDSNLELLTCLSVMQNKDSKTASESNNFKKSSFSPDRNKITLSFILNLIDGLQETSGRVLIITSNYYEKLDSAIKRPGRIDISLEMKKTTKNSINDMCKHFYGKHIPKSQLKQIEDYKYSPAEIINKRIQSPCLNDFIKLL